MLNKRGHRLSATVFGILLARNFFKCNFCSESPQQAYLPPPTRSSSSSKDSQNRLAKYLIEEAKSKLIPNAHKKFIPTIHEIRPKHMLISFCRSSSIRGSSTSSIISAICPFAVHIRTSCAKVIGSFRSQFLYHQKYVSSTRPGID